MGGIMMPYMGEMAQMGYVTPNQIPSLQLWYNASASTTVVAGVTKNNFDTVGAVNGSSIGTWNDLSGTGHPSNVNGGTGKQPTYAIPVQGGNGAILYNAANGNNLDINPTAWSQNLSGLTLYIVARPTSLPGTVFPLITTDTNFGIWWNGTNWTIGHSAGNYATISLINDTNKFHIYGLVFDGTRTNADYTAQNQARLDFIYDLYEKSPNASFTGNVGTTTGAPTYWFFGGDNRGSSVNSTFASTYMSGYLGEVMIWTRALSHAEQTSVELYLNTKWKLGLT